MKSLLLTLVFLKTLLIVTIIVTIAIFRKDNNTITIHKCNWNDCAWINKPINPNEFVSKYGHEPYTDSWCIELTHYTNPKLTHQQCEDYLFANVE